jgi:hypothetical protein
MRQHHRWPVPWTLLVLFIRSFEYGMVGAFGGIRAALNGLMAALAGKTGRPDHVLRNQRR